MPVEEEANAFLEKKNVLVGIRIDSDSRELLNWALVKVAEPGDCVVAIHVCRSSDHVLKNKLLLDGYLEVYEGLCSVKKVDLTGEVLTGSSVRKVLVREAKNYAATALVVGISRQSALGGWTSMARRCAKRLPPTTDVLGVHNGKIAFRRCNSDQLPGTKVNRDPKPSYSLTDISPVKEWQSEFGDSEAGTEISTIEVIQNTKQEPGASSEERSHEMLNIIHEADDASLQSASPFAGDSLEQRPGWPLLRGASLLTPSALDRRNTTVVQWVMSLPDRSLQSSPQCSPSAETQLEKEVVDTLGENSKYSSSAISDQWKELETQLRANLSGQKWFSYEVLSAATSQFSSENLTGKGGCNRVYKGILSDGKVVAVKILRSSKEAWKEFSHEVDIISSLKHKHITPLLGLCIKDNDLISVYDFASKGSLEENLTGKKKDKYVLSWEVRFNISVGIAEALNYLHSECSQPVIHRDVKSSNILLSDGFEPQLSDFGLAIWGPTTSSFLTQSDVVGTFGYLAPEYFMYGKVSDKIDVYAFGVVLLELLSGRKPICSETPKGQESLVMWAKPMIESGDVKGILDPELGEKFDEVQIQRMVLAATLCLTQAARLRPKMREVLKLLRGDYEIRNCMNSQHEDPENQDCIDDEVYPNSSAELHLGLALLDTEDASTSFSSMEQSNNLSPEEYLRKRLSPSSSFD